MFESLQQINMVQRVSWGRTRELSEEFDLDDGRGWPAPPKPELTRTEDFSAEILVRHTPVQ